MFSAESRLIHAGTERMPGRPATPPLAPASIYVSQGTPHPGRGYGRDGNPGWEALEQALGGLEDAEAVVFASGQAAWLRAGSALSCRRTDTTGAGCWRTGCGRTAPARSLSTCGIRRRSSAS